ncbi:BTB POZ domain containing 6 [Echinococcus multilocularis]|uniref:BTB POZ domain containing 6 n=1 Tax=Echinococcus multilocularis TaxID=6211 RepID=A0A068Y0Q2_ECHMU|nr:BTB POZ domain containing 6 [Echinococcus multilocularis]
MSDDISVQTAVQNDVDPFDTSILRNDAGTDNSGTDIASSPDIRLDRLSLYNSFAFLDSAQNRGAASSTIRLGVDGNHSAGPHRTSTRHNDVFASLAELDDESPLEPSLVSPYFARSSGHINRSQHWYPPIETPGHRSTTTVTNDNLFDRYLNRLLVDDPVGDSDVFPEVPSKANELEEHENVVAPTDWRTNCKSIQDRLRSILCTERFTDVYFYIGGGEGWEKAGEHESKTHKRDSRCNGVLSPRPPMCPTSRRSTASAQRRQNAEQQRRITSAIAQASGNASAVAQTTPAASDAEDLETEARNRDATVAEKAETLAAMLLSMRDTADTPETPSSISSSPTSTFSSPSEVCPYFTKTTNTAVMCHLSDISDIDIESLCQKGGGRNKSKDRAKVVLQSTNLVTQSTAKEVAHSEVKRFSAHRLVLAIASPVFEAMFFGSFAEATGVLSSRPPTATPSAAGVITTPVVAMEIHVTDVTPAAFQQCLHYIYYDDMTLTDTLDDLYDTLYAAKKYLLTPLATACKNRLISLMTPQNVLLQLNRCSAMDEDELFKICWHTIDVLTPEVLTSEHFTYLERRTLLRLISRETLYCEEWEIFEALMRWSKLECTRTGITDNTLNVAKVMGDFLPYIRFTTMSLEDFIIHVSKSDILSLEVQHTILLQIATKMFAESENAAGKETAETTSSMEQEGETNISPQKRKGPQIHKCRRFTQTVALTSKEAYWSDTEYVIFKVSQAVFLAGVGLFRPMNKGTQLKVKVEVRQCTLNQSDEVNSPNGGFPVTYRSTGVSTLISGGSGHRRGHRHAGIQMSSYLRSSNDSRRRRESSSHGSNAHPRLRRTAEATLSPSTTIPRTLFKSVESRSGALCTLEATLNYAQSTSPVVETRFSRPIKLKSNHYYLLSVTPEEGRNTRCYLSRAPARSRVTVHTHIPSATFTIDTNDSSMVATEHTPQTSYRLVNFDFAFGSSSVSGDAIGGRSGSADKHLVSTLGVVGEAPHVPYILFFPVS